MSIIDGSTANASNFNSSFVSRSAAQSVGGGKQFTNYISLTESAVASAATITALSSSSSKVRLTGSTATSLQGITAGVSGQVLILYNATSVDITVTHQNAGATAADRIVTYSATSVTLTAGDTLTFTYDATLTRWVQSSSTVKQSAAGGGGAGFSWKEISGTAPVPQEEYGENSYLFGAGLAQELYATIKVPQSYTAGLPISVYISGYSPSSSNTILFRAQSTLIRPGSTAFDSTTNQRTTTNSALTNTVANQLREFILDVTSSIGQINAVSVAAGDVIKIRLYRDTDTDTADLRMIPNSTDVKFS